MDKIDTIFAFLSNLSHRSVHRWYDNTYVALNAVPASVASCLCMDGVETNRGNARILFCFLSCTCMFYAVDYKLSSPSGNKKMTIES